MERSNYKIIVNGKVRYRHVRRSFAKGYVATWNRLNGRGTASMKAM